MHLACLGMWKKANLKYIQKTGSNTDEIHFWVTVAINFLSYLLALYCWYAYYGKLQRANSIFIFLVLATVLQ